MSVLTGVDNNINIFLNMKRKEGPTKPTKSKSTEATHKKSLPKIKSKSKDVKKEDESLFVLVGDSFYLASSKTERRNYEQFEQKVKVAGSSLKKSRSKPNSHFAQNINLQEYVKTLSKEEKASLLRDLTKEVEPERLEEPEPVKVEEDKVSRLMDKLEGIKGEMLARWEDQIGKINHCFENEQIGLEEKNEKISLIQKIKNNKIAMINYTKLLFEKILRDEPDAELEKSERMEHIINSLNSISSIDPREPIHLQPIHLQDPREPLNFHDPRQLISSLETPSFNVPCDRKEEEEEQHEHQDLQALIDRSPHSEQENCEPIKIEECDKSESLIMSREHLKLDIRLDEVEFGKDHYEEEIIFTKPPPEQAPQPKTEVLKLDFVGQRREAAAKQPIKHTPQDQFLCVGEQNNIQIPLLMTKDRLEQLQLERSAKEIQILTQSMKTRQSYQISEFIPDGNEHFTTLIDVNQFIVQFYEFIIRQHINDVIEGMNAPYGKSCIDKLYLLREEGIVSDEHTNVLTEDKLQDFFRYVLKFSQDVRQLKEVEKIHSLALFHAFNIGLNVYRPYFELQGEVFPWNTSEKGLTFYQINQDNIEEVFEKSKMKVLECCSSLCGLSPECQITTPDAKNLLLKRNEECGDRVMKAELTEQFGEWNTRRVNFEALYKINLCEQIFTNEIERFCEELFHL